MRKYLNITLAVLAIALLAACNKEKPVEDTSVKLSVLNSQVTFNCQGGEGTIQVEAEGAVSATSDRFWASVSVNGKTVSVHVDPWGKLESRYAKVTIRSGDEKTDVAVLQTGVTLSFEGLSLLDETTLMGEAGTYRFPFVSEGDLTVTSDNDWLSVRVEDGEIVVVTKDNPDKAVRHGSIQCAYGEASSSVDFVQYPIFEKTEDWVLSFEGRQEISGNTYAVFKNTVQADQGKYALWYETPGAYASSGIPEDVFVRDVVYSELTDALWEIVASYNGKYKFSDFLSSGTDTDGWTDMTDGDYWVYAVGLDGEGYPTGWYAASLLKVGEPTPYEKWLGSWSVPRGDGADIWIVEPNVEDKSYKVSGIAGFDANDYAEGAFVAIVNFDAETEEMVFAVYENTSVTWQDSSRGAMNALLSGQYKNVEGKTYYNSGVGDVICRAKLSEDGLTADLTPGSVTSAGAPAFFYNIRWYGRYTNSSGSRSGVSWTGYETALPNVMTKQ